MTAMKKFIAMVVVVSLMACTAAADGRQDCMNNREPLLPKKYMELPLGSVRADGWLLEQLRFMADGMTGHLDEIVPNLMGDRNGWLGGDGDKWERGPYWIDGLLPLAYIIDDDALKAKALRWVEWTLASQKEDGFFGPDEDLPNVEGLQRDRTHDWWPRIVVLKILQQYYDATSDPRVIEFMTKYFRYQLERLPVDNLGRWSFWAVERGGDNIMVVYWLYNITGDKFLLELGDLLTRQTADWKGRLSDGHTLSDRYSLHCVNLAQGFKTPVIEYQANGDEDYLKAVDTGYRDLMKHLGWPNGMYGADEWLHSANPTQGSEFCSAVELMFSLERMIEITGRTDWADWLEKIAYNALPTQATDNYDGRQYYQQLNQVEISHCQRNFMTCYNGTEGTFGPVTGFPCCTANMHQGWPKFVRDLWMATEDGGLAAMYYGPSSVTAPAGGTVVTLAESGTYPFGEDVVIKVSAMKKCSAEFPLHLRIPGWCKEATVKVNGAEAGTFRAGDTAVIRRKWKKGDELVLHLPMDIRITRWYEESAAVERGPLVYALKMEEKWTKVMHEDPLLRRYGDWHYEVHSSTPWNWCFLKNNIEDKLTESFTLIQNNWNGRYPWNQENCPVEIRTTACRMPEWHLYNGSAGPLPFSPHYHSEIGPEEEIVLIPYGCTTLRITEFPVNY